MRLRPITVCCPETAILSQHWPLTHRWCPKTWNNWANYLLLLATTLIYSYDLLHFVTVKVKTQRSCYHPQIIYWIKKQLASSLSLFTSITRSFHASSNRKLICKSPILLTDFFSYSVDCLPSSLPGSQATSLSSQNYRFQAVCFQRCSETVLC